MGQHGPCRTPGSCPSAATPTWRTSPVVRASRMASSNTMSHTVGGNLADQLDYRDVQWYATARPSRWSTAAWTVDAARAIYRSWMNSAPHRALLMSARFNYIGLGLALSLVQRPDVRLGRDDRVRRPHPTRWPGSRRRAAPVTTSRGPGAATTRASRRTRPGCATSTSSTASATGPGGRSTTTPRSKSLVLRDRAHGQSYAHPRAGDRPAWQCGPVDARATHLGALTGPVRRHPFAAVNLISDPIHGYIELTKRLGPAESAAAGLPDEDVAEEDLLDTAWLQRLRRISQLQSARWVFPTAEHSRFTHGLGVMHEAGLWARSLYPSLRSALAASPGRHADPVRGAGHRDPADGRAPPRRRPRAVRPLLRRPRAGGLRGAGRSAPARTRKRLTHEDLSAADHQRRARPAAARAAPGARARSPSATRSRDGESIDPALGRVPRSPSRPWPIRRCRAGCAGCTAAVGRVHRRQPRLRPPRRLPDRRRGGPDRRRAAAPLHVHRRGRADAVRAGPGGPRDVPDGAAVHVPAGLLPPDRARDRPRPRRGLRAVRPGDLRRRLAGRAAGRLRRPRRVRAAPPGRALGPRRGRRGPDGGARPPATGACRPASRTAGGRSCCAGRRWRAEAEVRAEYEAGEQPDALIATLGEPEPGRVAIDLAIVDARPADAAPRTGCSRSRRRDGRALSLAAALASIPAYWLIGRRYRRR